MTPADVAPAVEVWTEANDTTRRRVGLPVGELTPADRARQEARMAHLQQGDPAGSWVADDGGRVVGLSQSFVREGYWVLALLGVGPAAQGQGLGRRLLEAALTHGPGLPGTIQCSRDPAAMRLYHSAGFALHPTTVAHGPVRPGALSAHPGVRTGGPGDLGALAAVDRAVRGAGRPADLAHLLAQDGHRLLVLENEAYAVVNDTQVVTLAGRTPAAAGAVLTSALAGADPQVAFGVGWLTAPQQWAYEVVLAAGLELVPMGPVMVRGMAAPPWPYVPSGGLG